MKPILVALLMGFSATSVSMSAHASAPCLKDGESTTDRKACCSRYTVPGVQAGAVKVCGSRPITDNPCIGPGGVDDTLFWSSCCSGQSVPGSTKCLDPADYGNSWKSCFHMCL